MLALLTETYLEIEIVEEEGKTEAMQDKFDILERLERHGDINDPVFLRAELQRNSFLLAH